MDIFKKMVLGELIRKNFKACLTYTSGRFELHNTRGDTILIDRSKALLWLKSDSSINKVHSNIEKYLPEYYN
jgi:hypothetical protein